MTVNQVMRKTPVFQWIGRLGTLPVRRRADIENGKCQGGARRIFPKFSLKSRRIEL